MSWLRKVQEGILEHTFLYFRGILFLAFLGHGLVSMGYSPGYELHYRIFQSINFFEIDTPTALWYLGSFDLLMAAFIALGISLKQVLAVAMLYLLLVAGAGWVCFSKKTGIVFGFAESFRRFAWILYAFFLWLSLARNKSVYPLLRFGIAFAFLAHGLASLGLFGFKGAHIELASQIFPEDLANKMVYYSGFTDTLLGVLMMTGIASRWAAAIGSVWLSLVVVLSFMVAFPDGIFRTGFFLSAIYVALDERCHLMSLSV